MSHKMNSLLQWNQCGERFCGGSIPDVGELVLGEGTFTKNVQTLQNRGGNPQPPAGQTDQKPDR